MHCLSFRGVCHTTLSDLFPFLSTQGQYVKCVALTVSTVLLPYEEILYDDRKVYLYHIQSRTAVTLWMKCRDYCNEDLLNICTAIRADY